MVEKVKIPVKQPQKPTESSCTSNHQPIKVHQFTKYVHQNNWFGKWLFFLFLFQLYGEMYEGDRDKKKFKDGWLQSEDLMLLQ